MRDKPNFILEVLDNAYEELKSMCETAYEGGYDNGYDDGYNEAEEEYEKKVNRLFELLAVMLENLPPLDFTIEANRLLGKEIYERYELILPGFKVNKV